MFKLINNHFKEEIEISEKDAVRIGREEENDICLCQYSGEKIVLRNLCLSSISRYHGVFYFRNLENGLKLFFKDESRFGSFVDRGEGYVRISETALGHGDKLRLGQGLEYEIVDSEKSAFEESEKMNMKSTLTGVLTRIFRGRETRKIRKN